ncbi:hypothetical protein [Roseateles sp.]|uniref:hypothetical protein n=1 Tax=Roseateles sp. TaxID=1971397 RepID=UPI0025EAE4E2|nr:hypothetical protein [Roseateles sp.]MBV8036512.1 hypothetical protein [Roseateles sp.]
MKLLHALARLCTGITLLASAQAFALPTPLATWNFNGTLAAAEAGAPALTAIDPLGANAFVTDMVFGVSQTVYQFNGNALPANQQAGLSVSTNGLLTAPNAYTVDMIFKFNVDNGSWKSILNASDRTSDNAFYVSPGNKLQVYPVADGPSTFTFGDYHRISLTNNGAGHVTAYFDGIFQFDLLTTVMDFSTYGAANPDHLLTFFADNLFDGGQGEFVSGSVAQIRLYDGELSGGDVGELPNGSLPEPGTLLLVGLSLTALARARRLRL